MLFMATKLLREELGVETVLILAVIHDPRANVVVRELDRFTFPEAFPAIEKSWRVPLQIHVGPSKNDGSHRAFIHAHQ